MHRKHPWLPSSTQTFNLAIIQKLVMPLNRLGLFIPEFHDLAALTGHLFDAAYLRLWDFDSKLLCCCQGEQGRAR